MVLDKNERWEVAVTVSEGQMDQVYLRYSESDNQKVSFVNSICTVKGGTHVNYVAGNCTTQCLIKFVDKIVEEIRGIIKKKNKVKKMFYNILTFFVQHGVEVKPHQIKAHMWIFVRSLIENPAFDSQVCIYWC